MARLMAKREFASSAGRVQDVPIAPFVRKWATVPPIGVVAKLGNSLSSWLHDVERNWLCPNGMIIRGTEEVNPREIEKHLYTHPESADETVFGVSDAKLGEAVCAWVVTTLCSGLTAEEVIAFCRDQLAPAKVPARVRFVDLSCPPHRLVKSKRSNPRPRVGTISQRM